MIKRTRGLQFKNRKDPFFKNSSIFIDLGFWKLLFSSGASKDEEEKKKKVNFVFCLKKKQLK